LTIQQPTQVPDRHGPELSYDSIQQVNCKGDKIENITQLLMHLGMDNIKDKCDGCDSELRKICLEKQANPVPVKRDKIANKVADKKASIDSQCAETNLLKSRETSDKKRAVESQLVLSSIFASLFVVAITLQ